MRIYRLADLTVGVDTEPAGRQISESIQKQMKPYEAAEHVKGRPQICVTLTPEMIAEERRIEGEGFPVTYLASVAVYRAFCEQALYQDVLFFHSAAVAMDGAAYLFSGPSGAGKSTHASMWKKCFGDAAVIVNDDKPLIRFLDGHTYVYGTPWDGKFHRNANIRVPIRALCFLDKADHTEIRRVSWQEARGFVRDQSFRAAGYEHRMQEEHLINMLLNRVPVYQMKCDISTRAAKMAYDFMGRTPEKMVDHRTVVPFHPYGG